MGLAVFDIDGVVADVRHRLHHLEGRHKNWPAFFRGADADPLLHEGKALVHELAATYDIVWLTGRPDWLRATTRGWLLRHELPVEELYMRAPHDYRPARRMKLDVLHRLAPREVAAFVDDDASVIDAAHASGFPAVLADWVTRTSVLNDAQDRWGRT